MKRLDARQSDFSVELATLLKGRHDPTPDSEVEAVVSSILADVRSQGDEALLRYTNKFDRFEVQSASELVVSPQEIADGLNAVDATIRSDLEMAAERIRIFHERQLEKSWSIETEDAVYLAHRCSALDAVGVYVPGGTAAYPSSVLMNVIPAKVAGVSRIVMVTPAVNGTVAPAVLAAAHIAGADLVIRVGGAQAVGALAWGTATVPRVDKIVGPGNQWVAAAKRRVFGLVDIDMIAGPSELCVVATADGGATAVQIAADLLSQAEHDPKAMVSLVSPDSAFVDAVEISLREQLTRLPRRGIAEAAVNDHGLIVLTSDIDEAISVANTMAPEHLELVIPNALEVSHRVTHAGAIFCGPHTPEAIGDYIAGPNHVLPTNGTARFFSPLGVYDFVKRTNVIQFSEPGLHALGPSTVRLAHIEGLHAHANSVQSRLDK